jgi:hypothetical protein
MASSIKSVRAALICLGMTAICCGLLSAEQRPAYNALKTPVPVQVDGRLDDPIWSVVPKVGPFVNNRDGSPSPLRTEAWITYDDDYLYFAFRVWDTNIWATMDQRDQHLWTEEVVEVFLQADPAHPSYIELEVNPLGAMLDIFLLDIRKPLPYESWNSARLKWAVQVDGTVDGQPGDREWTCEIALPMEDVVTAPNLPPKPGDRWRMNLYRVEAKPEPAALAWAPTRRPDFHVPSMFGDLVFTGKPASLPARESGGH